MRLFPSPAPLGDDEIVSKHSFCGRNGTFITLAPSSENLLADSEPISPGAGAAPVSVPLPALGAGYHSQPSWLPSLLQSDPVTHYFWEFWKHPCLSNSWVLQGGGWEEQRLLNGLGISCSVYPSVGFRSQCPTPSLYLPPFFSSFFFLIICSLGDILFSFASQSCLHPGT